MEQSARHLAVILFTDIVGSVDFKHRLGTEQYARLLARHRELFQSALRGGAILQSTGDGFLVEFQAPSQAVNTALAFQYLLAHESWPGQPLRVRVGIHQGEVLVEPGHQQDQPQLVGLAIDLAARVMGLAHGGQILLTRSVFDDARQYVREHPPMGPGRTVPPLRWMAHGRYLFKGMAEETVEVCEVGAEAQAPLSPPTGSEKARRSVADDEEETLGWRPAAGLEIPTKPGWFIEKRLGEGAYGEVWLAVHHKLGERHVFKFCFDVEKLRSFKREITAFRLLRDALGSRDDFVPLYGIELESPPYYLESEYVDTGNLLDWAQQRGGVATVSLQTRLDLMIATARAVAAAHSVGLIHKDIKPSNILIELGPDGRPRPRLSDFGIGEIRDRTRLRQLNITEAGFTQELAAGSSSSQTGTRLYAPPEYLLGKPSTVQGDIYSLGVLLYQLVVGDLSKPLAEGWERDVGDELLRQDIACSVDVDPDKRFANAEALARSLEELASRRQRRRQEQDAKRRAARLRALTRAAGVLGGVVVLVAILCAVGYLRERSLRSQAEDLARKEERAKREANESQRQAEEQRNIALDTLDSLVSEIQAKLEPGAGSPRGAGMQSLRESLLSQAVTQVKRLQATLQGPTVRPQRSTAVALMKLSAIFQRTGRTQEALDLREDARAIFEKLGAPGDLAETQPAGEGRPATQPATQPVTRATTRQASRPTTRAAPERR